MLLAWHFYISGRGLLIRMAFLHLGGGCSYACRAPGPEEEEEEEEDTSDDEVVDITESMMKAHSLLM